VPDPATSKTLGYIRFQWYRDGYSFGGLRLINYGARLKYHALGTGGTTKADDQELTGQHREGIELGALVCLRNLYLISIESAGFKWQFMFKMWELVCSLTRVKPDTMRKLRDGAAAKPDTLLHDPGNDVCVVIGASGSIRKMDGSKIKAKRLHVDEFRKWLKATLDINPPTKMIYTPRGNLIWDPRYHGKLNLKCLLLPKGGPQREAVRLWLQLCRRHHRPRSQFFGRRCDESDHIRFIWTAVIRVDTLDDPDLVTEYSSLLLGSLNKKGDAMLDSGFHCPSKYIVEKVSSKKLNLNGNRGRSVFYYSAIEGKDVNAPARFSENALIKSVRKCKSSNRVSTRILFHST
jgi:hypothetical protein